MGCLQTGRVYYLDWTRVVAIYSVMFYHTLQGLNWAHLFRFIPGFISKYIGFQAAALQIGIPLLFNIAGRAQALARPCSLTSVARERARRLLLPFIVVYIVFIPPWQFIDLEYDYNNPGIWNMKSRFFAWYVSYWTEGGWITHFDLAWLWFLPALYIITLLATPIFLVAEQRLRCKNIIIALTLFTLLSACLSVFGFSNGFIFFSFLAVFGPLGVAQIVPLPFEANATSSSLARALVAHNAIVIGSQMGIAQSFSYAAIDPPQDPSQSQKTSAHSPAAMMLGHFRVPDAFIWFRGFGPTFYMNADALRAPGPDPT